MQQDEKQYIRMTQTGIPRLVSQLALPTICSQLVSSIYNLTDSFFVSQLGTSAAAAVGIVFSVQQLINAFGSTLCMGNGSHVSRCLGQKRPDEASRFLTGAFTAAAVVGLLLMTFGLLFLEPLMRLLGSTETILPYSCDYARLIFASAPLICMQSVLSVTMRSEGLAAISTPCLMTGNVINLILDPIFIFYFDLGCTGAALATFIGHVCSFSLILFAFLKKQSILHISRKNLPRQFWYYREIVRAGSPTLCRQGFGTLSSALLNNSVKIYGDAAVAAMSIANRIYSISRSVLLGIGQGFQPVAGYNYGAKRPDRVKKAFWFATFLGTAVASSIALGLAVFAPQVMALFRHDDPEVIAIGTRALRMLCVVLPLLGYSTFVNQMYQCLGRSGPASLLASLRQGTLYIPLILILPRVLGFVGVPLTQPVADGLTFLISIPFRRWFFHNPEGVDRCLQE